MDDQSLDGLKKEIIVLKSMLAELRREQAFHVAIIDAIPGPFYVIDECGRFIRWNAYQRDKIIGRSDEFIGQMFAQETIHPDDRVYVKHRLEELFKNGGSRVAECRVLLRGGPEFRWFLLTGQRVVIDGQLFLAGVGIDITERKQAIADMAESENKFSSFFLSMSEGVALHEIICDDAGKPVDYRFLDINPAFENLTGLKKENIIGKTVLEVLPQTEPLWIEKYGNVALTGVVINFENYSAALGRYYHVVAFAPRKNQFAVIFTDITQARQVQEKLENNMRELRLAQTHMINSEKMAGIGRLAATITHELRNPLMYITANIGMLGQYFKTIEDGVARLGKDLSGACAKAQQDYAIFHASFLKIDNEIVQSIRDSSDGCSRANEIVAGLLDYARVDGTINQAVDLNCAIDKAIELVDSDIRYKCKVEKILCQSAIVLGNQRELEQVFVNLFMNASQAIEKDGLIKVESCVNDDKVVIRVQDNGRGVEREDINRLFEPFFTTKKDGEGTGLGLSIAHKIIERHGGDIAVDSKVGTGTTFIIKLPVKK